MAAPPENMSGKGLLFVNSRITSELLDESTYLKWYDEDHIPEVLSTSGISSAFRYMDEAAKKDETNKKTKRPYLAVYPLQDVGFLSTPEFANISVTSDMLPDGTSKLIYDLVDFDIRYYNLVQVYDPTDKGPGHTRSVFIAHLPLREDYPEDDFDRWYREEHLPRMVPAKGYLRSTRYKLIWGRNSETSRALKGMPSSVNGSGTAGSPDAGAGTGAGTGGDKLPKWFALHEFETEQVDVPELGRLTMTEWTEKVLGNCDGPVVMETYAASRTHGDEDMFQGVKM